MKNSFTTAATLGIVFCLMYPTLGIPEVGGSSEAREIHTARLVLTMGDWTLPIRNGLVPSKPPLLHWLSALLGQIVPGKIGGEVNAKVVRSVSLFASLLSLFLTAKIADNLLVRAYPQTRQQKRYRLIVPLLSMLVLASFPLFFRLQVDARVDMLFATMILLALYALLETPRWWLFFLGSAAAVLTKGPLGIVLPLLLGYTGRSYLFSGRLKEWFQLSWMFFIIPVVTWYLAAYLVGGDQFLWRVLFENVDRFLGVAHVEDVHQVLDYSIDPSAKHQAIRSAPWYEYCLDFLIKDLPWSVLFCWFFISEIRHNRIIRERRLMAYWFLMGLLFFSISAGKRHTYLLPLLPFVSIYVAWHIASDFRRYIRFLEKKKGLVWSYTSLFGLIVFFAVTILCPTILFLLADYMEPGRSSEVFLQAGQWLVSERRSLLIAFAPTFLCLIVAWTFRPLQLWLCGLSLLGLVAIGNTVGLGLKAEFKGFSRAASMMSEVLPADSSLRVLCHGRDEYFDPLLMYIKREAQYQQIDQVTWEPKAFYIAKGKDMAEIRAMLSNAEKRLSMRTQFRAYTEDRSLFLFTIE